MKDLAILLNLDKIKTEEQLPTVGGRDTKTAKKYVKPLPVTLPSTLIKEKSKGNYGVNLIPKEKVDVDLISDLELFFSRS
jgi:hypothetical protein